MNSRKARKQVKRLERELIELRATEAKRRKQLGEVLARAAEVQGQLAALQAVVADAARAPGSAATRSGPVGYCMREKRPVQIRDPKPVTLSNGRSAIAGICLNCGARVMVLVSRSPSPAELTVPGSGRRGGELSGTP